MDNERNTQKCHLWRRTVASHDSRITIAIINGGNYIKVTGIVALLALEFVSGL